MAQRFKVIVSDRAKLMIGAHIKFIAQVSPSAARETKTGILAAIGIGAMLFGGLILYRAPGGELLHLSAGFFVGVTLVVGVVFLFILRLVYRAMRRKPASGAEGMIGMKVRVAEGTGQAHMAMVRGEYWKILPLDPHAKLKPGDEAEVVRVDSLTLYVKIITDGHVHMGGNE